jgi:hypothetical protein
LSIKVAARPAGPTKPFEQIKSKNPLKPARDEHSSAGPSARPSDDYIKPSMALLLEAIAWRKGGSGGALPALTILAVGILQLFLYEKKTASK